MDKIEIIMFLGLSGFILFLFFYMLKRDKIVDSKLAAMELALEDLNQEIFKIKKDIKNIKELYINAKNEIQTGSKPRKKYLQEIAQEIESFDFINNKENIDLTLKLEHYKLKKKNEN